MMDENIKVTSATSFTLCYFIYLETVNIQDMTIIYKLFIKVVIIDDNNIKVLKNKN